MFPAIPFPVTLPILAAISWMATMSGKENSAVHNMENPNCAPACEYVAMPLGSSSDAPVMTPGPITSEKNVATPFSRFSAARNPVSIGFPHACICVAIFVIYIIA
jgi:hypothetical protein